MTRDMSSPASFSSGSGPSPGCGQRGLNSRAVAVVTNRWYREQRRAGEPVHVSANIVNSFNISDQDATRMLTLLKQRKISCILKVRTKKVRTYIKMPQRVDDKSPLS